MLDGSRISLNYVCIPTLVVQNGKKFMADKVVRIDQK
jgi:hypothetical protein